MTGNTPYGQLAIRARMEAEQPNVYPSRLAASHPKQLLREMADAIDDLERRRPDRSPIPPPTEDWQVADWQAEREIMELAGYVESQLDIPHPEVAKKFHRLFARQRALIAKVAAPPTPSEIEATARLLCGSQPENRRAWTHYLRGVGNALTAFVDGRNGK